MILRKLKKMEKPRTKDNEGVKRLISVPVLDLFSSTANIHFKNK